MNRRALLAGVLALAALAVACGEPGPAAAAPTGTVVVAAARTGSPVPDWNEELEQLFLADLARGAGWTFVTVDGRPSVAGRLPLTATGDNDLVRAGAANALRDEARRLLATVRAEQPEADLLAALDLAGRSLDGHPGPRTVVVLDSLLQTAGALRFQDHDGALLSADPAAVARELDARGELPGLAGIDVVLAGAGDTVAPQGPLPPPRRTALIALWTAVLERAGASVRVVQAPVAARPAPGVPPVSPVPVTDPDPVEGPVSLRDAAVGFVADQAVLRDPGQAAAALAPFAERLLAGRVRAVLTGTTSSAGEPAGRLALSIDRAIAVAGLLRQAGVPAGRIEVHGRGSDFPGFMPDRDSTGRLDPVLAARNRQVIIELVPMG
jgi:outer membrane protein OmpA-like peptidoglycan-associated protein